MWDVLLFIMCWVVMSTVTYIVARSLSQVAGWIEHGEKSAELDGAGRVLVVVMLSAVWPIGLSIFGTLYLVHKVLAKIKKEG